MKKIWLLLASLALSTSVFAQWEWLNGAALPGSVSAVAKLVNGQYAFLQPRDERVIIVDSTGQTVAVYNGQEADNDTELMRRLLPLPDSSVLVVSHYGPCATWGLKLIKIEPDGSATQNYLEQWDSENAAIWLPDGTYLLYNTGGYTYGVQKAGSDGSFIWRKLGEAGGFTDAVLVDTATIALASQQGVVLTDIEAEQDTLVAPYVGKHLEQLPSGNLFGYSSDSIWLLSPGFEVLATAGLPMADISDVAYSEERIAFLDGENRVWVLNTDLNALPGFQATDNADFRSISLLGDGYLLGGVGNVAPFVKHYAFDGSAPDYSKDIGLVDISLPSAPVADMIYLPYGAFYSIDFPFVDLSVRNYGTDTVRSFYLASFFPSVNYDPQHCYSPSQNWKKRFSGYNIAPGETEQLQWEIPRVQYEDHFDPHAPYEFCVRTLVPSGRLDRNSSNDGVCYTTALTNTDEASLPASFALQAFPNPASGPVSLQYQLPQGKDGYLVLINTTGQELARHPVEGAGEWQLPGLPPAVYLAVLWVEGKQVARRRVVKW